MRNRNADLHTELSDFPDMSAVMIAQMLADCNRIFRYCERYFAYSLDRSKRPTAEWRATVIRYGQQRSGRTGNTGEQEMRAGSIRTADTLALRSKRSGTRLVRRCGRMTSPSAGVFQGSACPYAVRAVWLRVWTLRQTERESRHSSIVIWGMKYEAIRQKRSRE